MAIIDFNSGIWSDPWFRKLTPIGKTLFIYLWTNNHKTLTGIYPIDVDTMQFETGLNKKQVKDTLSILYPKVKYDSKQEIVWVVNNVRHQFLRTGKISPKIIQGIEKALILLNKHTFIGEFLDEYNDILSIGYPYPIERVSIYPSGGGGGEGGGTGEGEGEKKDECKKEKSNEVTVEEFVSGWNEICGTQGFDKIHKVTPDRRKRIKLRLSEHKDIEFWEDVLNKIPAIPFLRGDNDRSWRANIDWLIANDTNAVKIMEGFYEKTK